MCNILTLGISIMILLFVSSRRKIREKNSLLCSSLLSRKTIDHVTFSTTTKYKHSWITFKSCIKTRYGYENIYIDFCSASFKIVFSSLKL